VNKTPHRTTPVEEKLLDAWQRLMSFDPPVEALMNVLIGEVERCSGVKVSVKEARELFKQSIAPLHLKPPRRILTNVVVVDVKAGGEYIHHKPAWFQFNGLKHRVSEWRELLETISKDFCLRWGTDVYR
jgi:hypothetical protein